VDGTPQSHVDLEDPTYLSFEYVRRMGHVIDRSPRPAHRCGRAPRGRRTTLARYVALRGQVAPAGGGGVDEVAAAVRTTCRCPAA
jgi:hypothetical protein